MTLIRILIDQINQAPKVEKGSLNFKIPIITLILSLRITASEVKAQDPSFEEINVRPICSQLLRNNVIQLGNTCYHIPDDSYLAANREQSYYYIPTEEGFDPHLGEFIAETEYFKKFHKYLVPTVDPSSIGTNILIITNVLIHLDGEYNGPNNFIANTGAGLYFPIQFEFQTTDAVQIIDIIELNEQHFKEIESGNELFFTLLNESSDIGLSRFLLDILFYGDNNNLLRHLDSINHNFYLLNSDGSPNVYWIHRFTKNLIAYPKVQGMFYAFYETAQLYYKEKQLALPTDYQDFLNTLSGMSPEELEEFKEEFQRNYNQSEEIYKRAFLGRVNLDQLTKNLLDSMLKEYLNRIGIPKEIQTLMQGVYNHPEIYNNQPQD